MRFYSGCNKDLCCHLFLFAVVVDVATELAKECTGGAIIGIQLHQNY